MLLVCEEKKKNLPTERKKKKSLEETLYFVAVL